MHQQDDFNGDMDTCKNLDVEHGETSCREVEPVVGKVHLVLLAAKLVRDRVFQRDLERPFDFLIDLNLEKKVGFLWSFVKLSSGLIVVAYEVDIPLGHVDGDPSSRAGRTRVEQRDGLQLRHLCFPVELDAGHGVEEVHGEAEGAGSLETGDGYLDLVA